MEYRFIKKHEIIGRKIYQEIDLQRRKYGVLFFGDGSVLVQKQDNIKMVATMSYPYFMRMIEVNGWIELEK